MRKPVQYRQASQEVVQETLAKRPTVSFATDIAPLFQPFQNEMMWRFDLTNYEAVVANAQTIYDRISSSGSPMPPPPFDPLTKEQIHLFHHWMVKGCPP